MNPPATVAEWCAFGLVCAILLALEVWSHDDDDWPGGGALAT